MKPRPTSVIGPAPGHAPDRVPGLRAVGVVRVGEQGELTGGADLDARLVVKRDGPTSRSNPARVGDERPDDEHVHAMIDTDQTG